MSLTTDPEDPELGRGINDEPGPQNAKYLILSEEERAKGFVRPVFTSYVHAVSLGGCGAVTTMGRELCETYARQPDFYGATYCAGCRMHKRVGEHGEFYWMDSQGPTQILVGT